MAYLRQIPAMFSVDLTEFEADVPVLISGNEKGLNVTELKEACENDKYSVTLLVDVTGETQDKLYFTKVAYSEENGGYFFAGGNDNINGLMIEFAETVTGTHMILLGFKGAGGGGVAVMTREEWNAVEKKNDYGLVAVLDYDSKYIAGTLYNGAYYVEGFFEFRVDNGIFTHDNFNITNMPVTGIDENGDYFIAAFNPPLYGTINNVFDITTENIVLEFEVLGATAPQSSLLELAFGGNKYVITYDLNVIIVKSNGRQVGSKQVVLYGEPQKITCKMVFKRDNTCSINFNGLTETFNCNTENLYKSLSEQIWLNQNNTVNTRYYKFKMYYE